MRSLSINLKKCRLYAWLLAAMLAGNAQAQSLPESIQEGNILHCFNWTLTDVKNELASIADAGFGAVQLSPLQRAVQTGWNWSDAYRPYDFKFISSAFGTAEELKSLCAEAEKYGVKVIVDVVFNHVDGTTYHDSWWNSNNRLRYNGGINYGDRYSITHGQLGDYPDVNSEDSEVAARAKAYIEELKGYGVKGIRFDAAKHVGLPSEGCAFWSTVCSVPDMYYYGEILDNPGGNGDALMKEYTNYMSVTDNGYSDGARNAGGTPSGYAGWAAGTISDSKVVYWGESHDTYSNSDGASKYTSQDVVDRAYAIVACRNNATALYLSRPSASAFSDIKVAVKGSTHYTDKSIAEVNKFRNAMVGKADYYSCSSGVASVTRKDGGAVIVKNGGGGSVSATNGAGYVPAGTYTDRVSGNTFTVTSTTISGTVGSSGIAVIYDDVTPSPTCTLSPNGGSFRTETTTVTATLKNATSGTIKVGDGAAQTFTGTTTVTLGEGMSYGDKVTVTWTATDGTETNTGSATYTKVDPNAGITVYCKASSAPYLYAWTETNGTATKLNGEWPGKQMTETATVDGTQYYCTTFTDVESFNIIFNNGSGSQTDDIKGITADVYYTYDGGSTATVIGQGGGGGGGGGSTGNYPATLYLIGNVNNWTTSTAIAATGDNGVYTWANTELPDAGGTDAGKTFFSFLTMTGASWDAVNQADRYGAQNKDEAIGTDGTATIRKFAVNVDASLCYSWYATPGTYTITVDLTKNLLTLSQQSTAIDALTTSGLKVYANGGNLYVVAPTATTVTISTASGISTVRKVNAGTNVIEGLGKGLYIVNRTKVVL